MKLVDANKRENASTILQNSSFGQYLIHNHTNMGDIMIELI
jgi:hypothetical protein